MPARHKTFDGRFAAEKYRQQLETASKRNESGEYCGNFVADAAISGYFGKVDRAYRDRNEVFESRLDNIQNSRQLETVFYFFVVHK